MHNDASHSLALDANTGAMQLRPFNKRGYYVLGKIKEWNKTGLVLRRGREGKISRHVWPYPGNYSWVCASTTGVVMLCSRWLLSRLCCCSLDYGKLYTKWPVNSLSTSSAPAVRYQDDREDLHQKPFHYYACTLLWESVPLGAGKVKRI